MIPVLGVPVLTSPEFLWRMLETVDVEIGELIIVDNGNVIAELPDGVQATVVKPGYNMGVGAAWNHVIKMRPRARWWALFNFDLEFAPGDCAALVEAMESRDGLFELGVAMAAFAIDRETIRRVGWFDENYVPAYFEDNDYHRRCHLAGVDVVMLPSATQHHVSTTLRSSRHYQDQNHYSFPYNRQYYIEKWGGLPYRETYETPFNAGGDIRHWHLEIDRLSDLAWRIEEP
jgi:GT2 family glycosyltransferase